MKLPERVMLTGVVLAGARAFGARADLTRVVRLALPCRCSGDACVEHGSPMADEDECIARRAALDLYEYLEGDT